MKEVHDVNWLMEYHFMAFDTLPTKAHKDMKLSFWWQNGCLFCSPSRKNKNRIGSWMLRYEPHKEEWVDV